MSRNRNNQIENNPFPHSSDNKRYQTISYYFRKKYGSKCAKIPLNAGLTCPNRDGTKSTDGCTFCSDMGSGDSILAFSQDLKTQYDRNLARMHKKWPEAKGIPYFQSFSNTYAPLEKLKEIYLPFLEDDSIFCICIATRADVLEEDFVSWIAGFGKDIWIELGLQTASDQTGSAINRSYSTKEVGEAVRLIHRHGLKACIHLINGLPGESRNQMVENARWVSDQEADGIKIHMLHLIDGTRMAAQYRLDPFHLLSLEEYSDIVCDQLEVLPEGMVIERLTGDGMKEDLIGPEWTLRKTAVTNRIDQKMQERNSWQSRLHQNHPDSERPAVPAGRAEQAETGHLPPENRQ